METVFTGDVWSYSYAARLGGDGFFSPVKAKDYASGSWGVIVSRISMKYDEAQLDLYCTFPTDGAPKGIYSTDQAEGIVRDILHAGSGPDSEFVLRTSSLVSREFAPPTGNENKGVTDDLPGVAGGIAESAKAVTDAVASGVDSVAKGVGDSLGIGKAGAYIGGGLVILGILLWKFRGE